MLYAHPTSSTDPRLLALASAALLVVACADDVESQGQPNAGGPADLATNLVAPWGIAFLPDGSALIAERNSGTIKHMSAPGVVDPVGSVAGVAASGEGGLLGLATAGPTVFAYFTAGQDNRVMRMRFDGGHANRAIADWVGRLWATEYGANRLDELNLIRPGGNYGWPMAEGRADTPGLIDPVIQWGTSEASPSGLAYFGGSLWVAALRGQRLFQIPVGADGSLRDPAPLFVGQYGRLRTVAARHRTARCGSPQQP